MFNNATKFLHVFPPPPPDQRWRWCNHGHQLSRHRLYDGAGWRSALPHPRGSAEPVLLLGSAGDRGLGRHRVVSVAPLRQPAGLQALREELPCHRRGRRRRHAPGGSRHLRPARCQEHRAPRDPRRRAPRHQLQRRGRGPPPRQLPLRHHPPPHRVLRLRRMLRHGGRGVLRGGRASREHARRHARVRRHYREVQPSVARANRRELNAAKEQQQRLQVLFLIFLFFLLFFDLQCYYIDIYICVWGGEGGDCYN